MGDPNKELIFKVFMLNDVREELIVIGLPLPALTEEFGYRLMVRSLCCNSDAGEHAAWYQYKICGNQGKLSDKKLFH